MSLFFVIKLSFECLKSCHFNLIKTKVTQFRYVFIADLRIRKRKISDDDEDSSSSVPAKRQKTDSEAAVSV